MIKDRDSIKTGTIMKTSASPAEVFADDTGHIYVAKEMPDSWSEIDARLEAVRLKLAELSSRR